MGLSLGDEWRGEIVKGRLKSRSGDGTSVPQHVETVEWCLEGERVYPREDGSKVLRRKESSDGVLWILGSMSFYRAPGYVRNG